MFDARFAASVVLDTDELLDFTNEFLVTALLLSSHLDVRAKLFVQHAVIETEAILVVPCTRIYHFARIMP